MGGPKEDPKYAWKKEALQGEVGRYKHTHPNTYFEQPRTLWNKVFTETDRQHLIENMSGPLSQCKRSIQEGWLKLIFQVDPDYGTRLANAIGVPVNSAKL